MEHVLNVPFLQGKIFKIGNSAFPMIVNLQRNYYRMVHVYNAPFI